MQWIDNARLWYKKWSTWLAGSMGTALITYALLPSRVQDSFPDWFLFAIGIVVCFVVPTAVQVRQKGLHKDVG